MVQLVILLVLWLVGLPATVGATDRYVATTGSNGAAGTEAAPWLTIAYCVSQLAAGDTCYVRGGTYSEGLIRFSTSGTAASPIKLLNYPNELPIITHPSQSTNDRILIQHASGINVAMQWIWIEGFEITNGYEGIKFYNCSDCTFKRLHIHDNLLQGILGQGGLRNTFTHNIINHNGDFATCATTPSQCGLDHGLYLSGASYVVTNNLIYDNLSRGIQINGSSSTYDTSKHPSADYAGAANWVISDNTFAYQRNRAGIVIWGGLCDGLRIENNIFYENNVTNSSTGQGIEFVSATASLGMSAKNNHFYGSGSGATTAIGGTAPSDWVISGNVTNVSAPAFVNGGTNALPVSPDFRLTASAPVNIALSNEFLNNSTLVVGAFKTVANPTCSITTNKITCIEPMSTAVPIQGLSTTGVTVNCAGVACPGSPTVSSVSKSVGTDTYVEITIAGITGDACEVTNQTWTLSYTSTTGTWTTNDHLGTAPGLHQYIFSFTSLAVTNLCTGSGPTGYPAGYYLYWKMDENTGTNLNDESANNEDGTLTGTWGEGKTGSGVVLTAQSSDHVAVPHGNTVNPYSQNLTIAFGVNVTAGNESLSRSYFGAPLGTNQRFYISTAGSTWRIGTQTSSDSTASDLSVDTGWNHLCLTANATTHEVTLHKNGIASASAGGKKTVTSYTLAGDFDLGRIADLTNGGGGTFDDFLVYESVENCATIYAAFNAATPTPGGTFAQAAVQAQAVYLPAVGDTPTNLVALDAAKKVVVNGAIAWVFQVHCTNVSNCAQTSFRLAYRKNGAGAWQQVPNTETADGIYMWGDTTGTLLNANATTTRLTGSCAVTDGVTLLTSAQVPPVDLPQDGCVMLRWIVRVGNVPGDYFELRVETEGGTAFTGSYTLARIDVISTQSGGMGF